MSNDEVKKILSMSPKKQEAWVKKQEWFDKETFFIDRIDRDIFGVIHGDLDEQVKFELNNFNCFDPNETIHSLVSEKRYKEIKKGDKLSDKEIKSLKEIIKDQNLDDHLALAIMKKEIETNKTKLLLFFTVYGHPLGSGEEYEFEGVFKNDEDAMKYFSKYKGVEFW